MSVIFQPFQIASACFRFGSAVWVSQIRASQIVMSASIRGGLAMWGLGPVARPAAKPARVKAANVSARPEGARAERPSAVPSSDTAATTAQSDAPARRKTRAPSLPPEMPLARSADLREG